MSLGTDSLTDNRNKTISVRLHRDQLTGRIISLETIMIKLYMFTSIWLFGWKDKLPQCVLNIYKNKSNYNLVAFRALVFNYLSVKIQTEKCHSILRIYHHIVLTSDYNKWKNRLIQFINLRPRMCEYCLCLKDYHGYHKVKNRQHTVYGFMT